MLSYEIRLVLIQEILYGLFYTRREACGSRGIKNNQNAPIFLQLVFILNADQFQSPLRLLDLLPSSRLYVVYLWAIHIPLAHCLSPRNKRLVPPWLVLRAS
jgi:hypothetical protein